MTSESFSELPPHHPDSIYQLYQHLLRSADYRTMIERIARKQTRGTTLAWEDAAQTAYEKIILAIQANRFQYGGAEEFYRWSATIAHCTVVDLTRREQIRQHNSLDHVIPGTNTALVEIVSDPLDLWDAIERADLLMKVNAAIHILDQQYPDRHYLKLWQAKITGKRQTQLADELNIRQGTVSKRWKELVQAVAVALGLLDISAVPDPLRQKLKCNHRRRTRYRSPTRW